MDKCISVVVPVYNVEKYLKKCIDSILSQTYQNLEIILVDDGSTDKSGAICDSYRSIDERIAVIHKKNGGLSDARNAGIESSKGELIGFIDSDDFIDSDFYQALYDSMAENDADIAVAPICVCDEEGEVRQISRLVNVKVMNQQNAMEELLISKNISNSACNKLFSRKVIGDIRFPLGRYYEDEFTIYKWFMNAQKVGFVQKDTFYWYLRRKGSITLSVFTEKEMDRVYASEEKVACFAKRDKKLKERARQYLTFDCVRIIQKRAGMKNESFDRYAQRHIRKNIFVYLEGENSLMSKMFALCCCISLSLTKSIYKFLIKKSSEDISQNTNYV